MKTIIAIILTALVAIIPVMSETVGEETVNEVYMIEGTVVQNDENGILVNTADLGDVLVLTSDETIREGAEAVEAGDYVYVDYNGMMTRSLPAQITAMVIRSHRLDGTVSEIYHEENAMLISTETHGNVYVHLPAAGQDAGETAADEAAVTEDANASETENAQEPGIAVGDSVTVYFNGAMTMSLPGQINAGLVIVHPAEAA